MYNPLRKLITISPACLLVLFGQAAHASFTQPGYVTSVQPMYNGVVFIKHDGVRSTPPACQSGAEPIRWAIDATTPAGQAKLATLLTSYALHKPLLIVGLDSCPDWSDTETISYFYTG